MTLSLYLSPAGRDHWSGLLSEPAAGGDDGPLASLDGARAALRRIKHSGRWPGPVTVWIAGGRYPMRAPVTFQPDDCLPVTFAACPGETPLFDGGEPLGGLREETLNGRAAWVADLAEVAAGSWSFRSLFVRGPGDGPDGRRAPRARLPKVSPDRAEFYRIESLPGLSPEEVERLPLEHGQNRFVAAAGDFDPFHNLQDVEVVALHYWVEERLPVAAYDPATRTVSSSRWSVFRLTDDFQQRGARYYIDNVFEGLSEPGEWYLDRLAGRLYYLPLPGETFANTTLIAPRLEQFVRLLGDAANGELVSYLRFEGLTFAHADWCQPLGGWEQMETEPERYPQQAYAAAPQAAFTVPGAFVMVGAHAVTLEDCHLRHVGGYGIEVGPGCRAIRISGCTLSDLGAGGVHISGASAAGFNAGVSPQQRTAQVQVTDCTIAHGGRVFHAAVGVLIRHAAQCEVLHNHIFDFFYTGVSCGWVWGYAENAAYDNHIEHNHIHHLGHGWLSDMGGVYLLGVQPGTTVAGNLIHDVRSAHYGGWAIYPDEGSSHLIIENNVCCDVSQQPFHQHYGRENIVRNNVFAFGGQAQIALSRANPAGEAGSWRAFTFSRNVVITAGQPVYTGGYCADLRQRPFGSDLNLFYSVTAEELSAAPRQLDEVETEPRLSWAEWQALGSDRHSLVIDPGFIDIAARDFRLKPAAAAKEIGFVEIDLSGVGPRKFK